MTAALDYWLSAIEAHAICAGHAPDVAAVLARRVVSGIETPRQIAALFVAKGGAYFGLAGVDPWDQTRDARLYAGPWPVVAHPPCERWGRYHGGAPTTWPRLVKGDDGGCFAAALAAVRRWGGILEHPEASAAWPAFRLATPPMAGGWIAADWIDGHRGWTCCVEQGAYGHRARKATWLYAHGVDLPQLAWGPAKGDFVRLDEGFHSAEERARAVRTGACQRLSKKQRAATPVPFRDLLISIARPAHPTSPEGDPEASGAGIPPSLSAPAEAGCNRREQPVGASFCGEDG